MAYSWEQQIYPTGSQNVNVSIAFLDRTYIYVYLDGVLTTDYTWASDSVIHLDTPVTKSTEILLVRRTEKEYLFILFASGAPFISENLDTQNTQFLHLAQEMVEGRSIDGFYGDISMSGFKITNLGDGTEPGDAVNKGQLDEVDNRVVALEQTWLVPTSAYPWYTNTTEATDVLTPGLTFTKAAVYINGVCQTPGYSYEVVDNTIMLADPVPSGTHIMARLGEDVPTDAEGYATAEALAEVAQTVQNVSDGFDSLKEEVDAAVAEVDGYDVRVTALESTSAANAVTVAGKAKAGANSDITSLTGLTTALSVAQGGTGATTPAAARTALGVIAPSVSTSGSTVLPATALNVTFTSAALTLAAGTWLVSANINTGNMTAGSATQFTLSVLQDTSTVIGRDASFYNTTTAQPIAKSVVAVAQSSSEMTITLTVSSTASGWGAGTYTLSAVRVA